MVGAKAQEGYKGKKIGCEDENDPTEREVPMMQEKKENDAGETVLVDEKGWEGWP